MVILYNGEHCYKWLKNDKKCSKKRLKIKN